jgi:hypothetical protein
MICFLVHDRLEATAESSGDGAAAASVVGQGGKQLTGNASDKVMKDISVIQACIISR